MITFFKEGDARPEPAELVGKLVGKKSLQDYRRYSLPLLVVGHSGAVLHTKACSFTMDGMMPIPSWKEDVNMALSKVFYVCDTLEEAKLIRNAGAEATRKYEAALKAVHAEIDGLYFEVEWKSA